MAEMALIKYHYAYDESKQVININDVSSIERSKHSYYCVGCGAEMIPRLGKIKVILNSANCQEFLRKSVIS